MGGWVGAWVGRWVGRCVRACVGGWVGGWLAAWVGGCVRACVLRGWVGGCVYHRVLFGTLAMNDASERLRMLPYGIVPRRKPQKSHDPLHLITTGTDWLASL